MPRAATSPPRQLISDVTGKAEIDIPLQCDYFLQEPSHGTVAKRASINRNREPSAGLAMLDASRRLRTDVRAGLCTVRDGDDAQPTRDDRARLFPDQPTARP